MISLKNTLEAIKTSISNLSTDYIVEQGTNGIWTYRKWNSGIAECWGNTTFSLGSVQSYNNLFYRIVSAINYPFTFTQVPNEMVNAMIDQYAPIPAAQGLNTTTKTASYNITWANFGSTCKMMYYIVGKWK